MPAVDDYRRFDARGDADVAKTALQSLYERLSRGVKRPPPLPGKRKKAMPGGGPSAASVLVGPDPWRSCFLTG